MFSIPRVGTVFLTGILLMMLSTAALAEEISATEALVGALLGESPMIEDLRELTDEIGGRPTGSKANFESVEWGLRKFTEAGVAARKEKFRMPGLWLERSCTARISGDVSFDVETVSMPFSVATPEAGVQARLLDAGRGSRAEFERLGEGAEGAFLLVETPLLLDIDGLFREYEENVEIERTASEIGAAGVVFMSSRPEGILYRHNARRDFENDQLVVAMERNDAQRVQRLLQSGKELQFWVRADLELGGAYDSYNVIGEIKGGELEDEYVVIGAHLDSWGLGTGANDNGCNAAMMIDIARQMRQLDLHPRRTIRFALWNGEEQGLLGSWGYTKTHADELNRHVVVGSVDIGSGRINGFFTGGRPDFVEAMERALDPVEGLGPFPIVDIPIVGTDNYDFMMEGIANFVANQETSNYGPNYHATSDTFDKVDVRQLRINAAVVAAAVYELANMDVNWHRQSRSEIQALVDGTDLGAQMRTFNLMGAWEAGQRGRR
jgi:Iap family predicted aminopeptidase